MGQGGVRGGRRQEEMQINYRQRMMGTESNMDTHPQLQVRNSNASMVEHTPKSTSFRTWFLFFFETGFYYVAQTGGNLSNNYITDIASLPSLDLSFCRFFTESRLDSVGLTPGLTQESLQ